MDKTPAQRPYRDLARVALASLALGTILFHSGSALLPAFAAESRSSARIDIIVGSNGIVDPEVEGKFSVILRADESGTLGSGDITVSLTEDPFTSEYQIRRFIAGESSPVATEVATAQSPEVPQLETRELPFVLSSKVLSERFPAIPVEVSTEDYPDAPLGLARVGIFCLETTYTHSSNRSP